MITFFRSIFAPPRHLILPLVALWVGLWLAEKRTQQHGISKDSLSNIFFYGLFGYVLGGRLLYALANYPFFVDSPRSLFSRDLNLFDPLGAFAVACIVALVYGSRQKLSFWSTLDALTPVCAALAVGLSLAHLAAGSAFGSPTDLPWGIRLWNEIRHPTQIYELIASLLVFAVLWLRRTESPAGTVFLVFLALTAASRLFLEAFRGDSTLLPGGLRLAQVIAWGVLAVAFFAIEWIHRKEPANLAEQH